MQKKLKKPLISWDRYGIVIERILEKDEFVMTIALSVLQLIADLFLIVVILFQSGKRSGLSGAIAGGADTFMTKSKAKTWDAKLAKMTKWVAIVFVLLTLVLNFI